MSGPSLKRAQVRDLDRRATEDYGVPSIVLMENAGRGAAVYLRRLNPEKLPSLIIRGPGNNGGDGFVMARQLANCKDGRDHNHWGFTVWLAGGGVKGGMAYGSTDDFGFRAAENPVHIHDLHATMLHLLGLDHERLTYRYAGRDYRLTDVHGIVVKDIIA